MSDKLKERISLLEKQLKELQEKEKEREHDEYVKEFYSKQKGGDPPYPHF